MTDVQDTFGQAAALHQQGRLDEAEALYRQILETEPGHADAHHMLGVGACQRGDLEQGVRLIERAIAASPNDAVFHNNLGNALRENKRIDEALGAAGRSRDEYDLGALVLTAVSDDPEQAMCVARRSVAYYLMAIPDVSPRLIGTGVERAELVALRASLHDANANDGIETAAALIPDDLVHLLAVVGTADEVAQRLAELLRLGLDRVAPHHALGADAPASVRQLGAAVKALGGS